MFRLRVTDWPAFFSMQVLLNLFLDICLLRKGPQDVPASYALLKLVLVLYILSGLVQLLLLSTPERAALLLLLDVVLLAGLLYVLLSVYGLGQRWLQTLTALAGAGVILNVLALPLAVWLGRAQEADSGTGLPFLLWFGLLIWSIVIMTHVLQQALSSSRAVGMVCALGFFFLSWLLQDWLLPAASTPAAAD